MKKVLTIVLAVALIATCMVALFACGEDANKISVGVQAGTTGEAYVKGDVDWGFTGIPNTTVSSYKSISLAINDIKNGSIKYAVVDKPVAEGLVAANPNDIKMIDVDLTVEKYAIGVNKQKTQLLAQINTIIETIKEDGTLDAIYAAYAEIGEDDVDKVPDSDIYVGVESGDTNSNKTKLVLATNAAFAPYEYKVGTKFYGIDMEMAKIIAQTLDMELIISDMDFTAVVTAVQSGDADIAVACLTVNAKREKSVTFTTAYEEGASQVLIVKKDDTSFDACTTVEEINEVFKTLK